MAAVLEQSDAAAKHGSQVDDQLAQATSRIRAHDLAFGALVLVALGLVYATAMILLDKYLVLPEWVRQVALLGFVAAFAGTAYLTVVSPLRKKINPLYAAKQVESTIDDAKNSVTGYVDAQQKGTLSPTVKAALASRAAKSVAEADVNKAVDHRSLLYLGGVAIALFLALVVMFFVFRPAQFGSLVGRTFVPFSSRPVETRTQITLVKPEPAEPTITTGQSVSVAVYVGGKVPSADSPERMRLMVRHNPLDPNFTELPLVPGTTNRDWELRVPDYLVQNGFWYKIAGGDAETPEYKVTVRSLPLFTDFQATYEYPKYLRRKPETANDPLIKAYRGTVVTLVARTNRDVRDGAMAIEPGAVRVTGAPAAGRSDSVQFQFKLTDSGKYKLTFNATNGECSADPYQSTITVEADQPPQVVINKPEAEETEAPTNGQLAIDGKVGDDFGVDTITLKMKIVSPVERPLPDKPFLNGKVPSFRRAKDDTWPTDVDYKDSVDFATLKKDAAGLPLELTPEMVVEYWLEAADNCTEPKPNVGRSAAKRVRLTPPKVEEPEKEKLDQQKAERKNEEQKNNQQQADKFDKENREPPKNDQPQPKDGQPQKKDGEKGGKKDNADAKGGGEPQKKDGTEPPKKEGDNTAGTGGMPDPANPQKGKDGAPPKNDPNMNPMPPSDPMMPPGGMGMNPPDTAPPPKTMEEKDVQDKADAVKNAIEQENKTGGAAKPNDAPADQDRANPAQPKPQPPTADMGNTAESKPEPKPDQKRDPMQKNGAPPADAKPEGNVEKPADPSAPKPTDPKQNNPMKGEKPTAPAEQREEPLGAPPGTDKPEPKDAQPQPKDPKEKQDPKSGATAKPCDNPNASGAAGENPNSKKDPAAEAGSKPKPMPEPTRGGDKPNEPTGKPPADPKADAKPDAGDAKPDKAPPAATPKPQPKDDTMTPGGMNAPETKPPGDANEPKKPNGTGAAETKPDDKKNPPAGAANGKPDVEKGTDKPEPKDADAKPQGASGAGGNAPKPKELTEQEKKELEQAAKDLTSPDPKKKEDAQKKLDKAIGEDKRKELEKQAKKDSKGEDGKGKEPTKEELDALAKQAQDLQSMDDKTREKAEKELDDKIGKENRQQLQDGLKNKKPGDAEQDKKLKEQLEQMAKEQAKKEHDPKGRGLGTGSPLKSAMEDDPKNRLKTAELRLEEFERKRYDEAFQKKQGFTPEEYRKFLDGYEKHVQKLRDDAAKGVATTDKPPAPVAPDPGAAKLSPGFGGKVVGTGGPGSGAAGGATVAPPGFEGVKPKFDQLVNPKK